MSVHVASEELAPLMGLTDIAEIQQLIGEIEVEQAQVEKSMCDAADRAQRASKALKNVAGISARVNEVVSIEAEISRAMAEEERLGELISGPLRRVHDIRKRVTAAMSYADDIVALADCVTGVKEALQSGDLARATSYVNRYLRIDPALVEPHVREALDACNVRLHQILEERAAKALRARDETEILQICRYFAMLDEIRRGSECYMRLWIAELQRHIEALDQSIIQTQERIRFSTEGEKVSYATVLVKLLHELEVSIKARRSFCAETFGALGIAIVANGLQKEADVVVLKYLKSFQSLWEVAKLTGKAQRVLGKSKSRQSAQENDKKLMKEIPAVLNQISSISQALEAHRHYLSSFAKMIITALKKEEVQYIRRRMTFQQYKSEVEQEIANLTASGAVEKELYSLLDCYTALDKLFLTQNVMQILYPSNGKADVGALPDDTFFIIKESCSRAQTTFNVMAISAFINNADEVLSGDVREFLTSASNVKQSEDIHAAMSAMNALETCSKYLLNLKMELEVPARKQFKSVPSELQKIVVLLDTFTETDKKFRKALQVNLDVFFKAGLPKLQSYLENAVNSMNYEMNSASFESAQVNDPWVNQLTTDLNLFLAPIQKTFSSANFEWFLRQVFSNVTKHLEAAIFAHKFTKLGAKQLDKEFMAIMSFAMTWTKKGFRDIFERLQQITDLLNIDEAARELKEEWDAEGTRHVTNMEIHQVIQRRVEFQSKKAEILRLFK